MVEELQGEREEEYRGRKRKTKPGSFKGKIRGIQGWGF
jgi:hypothetical protein